jgi:hypothetical protein
LLQEKLQKAEAELMEYCEDAKDEHAKKVEFLPSSVMKSTEETLSMERKLMQAKKEITKFKSEKCSLGQKLESIEQPTKEFKEESDCQNKYQGYLQSLHQ